ncbi:reverse transcriptase domain-containing protein [Tanacetum coccineum]
MKLQSPQTLKEAQTLNGKLASLNRFLSKSAEKLLPFFKTIKRCVKKSDFQWTPEAKRGSSKRGPFDGKGLTASTSLFCQPYLANPINQLHLNGKTSFSVGTRHEEAEEILPSTLDGAFDITYRPRTSIRVQVLANFIAKKPDEEGPSIPEGEEFTYALRFEFDASNNEAEYEALVASLRIAEQMGVKNLIAKVDSRLVANQINGLYEAKEQSMTRRVEQNRVHKLRPPHQTSVGRNAKKKVNRREGNLSSSRRRRVLLDDTVGRITYGRKSFLEPWMLCVGPTQAEYVVKEIHEGSCSIYSGLRSVVAKAIRSGYYWPTMHKDARNIIRKCDDCQTHRPVPMNPQQKLTPITSPWLFYKWGIDISGPFPEAQGMIEDKKAAVREARNKAKMEKYYNAKVRSQASSPRDFDLRYTLAEALPTLLLQIYFFNFASISATLHPSAYHCCRIREPILLRMDKSKIARKQSKTGKHGHENQKSTKPKPSQSQIPSHFLFYKATRARFAFFQKSFITGKWEEKHKDHL